MKGYIYKLTSPHTDVIYIGSTIRTLRERFNGHKSDWGLGNKQRESSKVMFDCGDVSIHLIRECECDNIRDLRKQEQIEMDNYNGKICNFQKAFRVRKEYQKTPKYKAQQKAYELKHKEKYDEYKRLYKQRDAYKLSQRHYGYWIRSEFGKLCKMAIIYDI